MLDSQVEIIFFAADRQVGNRAMPDLAILTVGLTQEVAGVLAATICLLDKHSGYYVSIKI